MLYVGNVFKFIILNNLLTIMIIWQIYVIFNSFDHENIFWNNSIKKKNLISTHTRNIEKQNSHKSVRKEYNKIPIYTSIDPKYIKKLMYAVIWIAKQVIFSKDDPAEQVIDLVISESLYVAQVYNSAKLRGIL